MHKEVTDRRAKVCESEFRRGNVYEIRALYIQNVCISKCSEIDGRKGVRVRKTSGSSSGF